MTQYTYNAFGELINRRDPTNRTSSYEYDANGNPRVFIDGLGNRTEFDYNGFNLLMRVRHGGQTISEITYNELNKPVTLKDALSRTTTYGYDCQGNPTQVTDPLGNVTNYQVDALANLKKVIDARSNETSYLYDAANQQIARTGPDNKAWNTSYTPDNYIQTLTTPNGVTSQFQYDGMGRLTREIRPEKTIEYSYADCCRQSQVDEKIGAITRRTTYTYDGIGRLTSVTDPQNRTISYTYNGRGQRLTMATPGGLITNFIYDDAGRVIEIRTGADWARFTYDAAGRRTKTEYSNGASNNYTYNTRSQLTSVVIRDGANAVIASYVYILDANGNRTGVTYHDGTASLPLDALGRLTGETVNSASLGDFNKVYGYDAVGNRLDAGATFGIDNRLLNDSGGAYGYDNNGNIISRGAKTFSYDSQNRLTGFSDVGVSANYQYDFLGRRTQKIVNGIAREFLYDNADLVAEYVGGNQVARYTHGLGVDEPLMVVRSGQAYFYHADGLGSIVAITNAAGQTAHRYGYDAWGNLRLNSGAFSFSGNGIVNTLTFTGREYDDESGLYFYRARTYSPQLGRFLQKDALQGRLAAPQTQNLYSYVGNNPTNLIDPSGETALVGYAGALNSKLAQNAAAVIGFFHGYGATNLLFLGNYLELATNNLDVADAFEQAYLKTEEDVNRISFGLGILKGISGDAQDLIKYFKPDLSPEGKQVLGYVDVIGAYISGITVKKLYGTSTPFLNAISELTKIDGLSAYGISLSLIKGEIKLGGFKQGAALALVSLNVRRREMQQQR